MVTAQQEQYLLQQQFQLRHQIQQLQLQQHPQYPAQIQVKPDVQQQQQQQQQYLQQQQLELQRQLDQVQQLQLQLSAQWQQAQVAQSPAPVPVSAELLAQRPIQPPQHENRDVSSAVAEASAQAEVELQAQLAQHVQSPYAAAQALSPTTADAGVSLQNCPGTTSECRSKRQSSAESTEPTASKDEPSSSTSKYRFAERASKPRPYVSRVDSRYLPSISAIQNELRMRNMHDRRVSQLHLFDGLMAERDKKHIVRLQVQQIITQDPMNEDFYYQIYSNTTDRPADQKVGSKMERTYLYKRNQRGRVRMNPIEQMYAQVCQVTSRVRQRDNHEPRTLPEGSLGQTPSGNAAHPRKALSLVLESAGEQAQREYTDADVLTSLEKAYDAILTLESCDERHECQKDSDDTKEQERKNQGVDTVSNSTTVSVSANEDKIKARQNAIASAKESLWKALRLQQPLDEHGRQPFIMMLSHNKGKRLVQRAFPYLESTQRLTLLTRIVAQIDDLDVIKTPSCAAVELFQQTVLASIISLVTDAPMAVVTGLLDIILHSADVLRVAKSKVGQSLLTVIVSRAELIKQNGSIEQEDEGWKQTFDSLFDRLRPHLNELFPETGDDIFVWHFLAALGVAAELDQQRTMLETLRKRIFRTVEAAKSDSESGAIINLNLFLNVLGLNATPQGVAELQ